MKYAIRQEDHAQARISSFFFNVRGSPIERSPRGLYQSLLYQLLPHAPEQLSKLSLEYEETIQEATSGRNGIGMMGS